MSSTTVQRLFMIGTGVLALGLATGIPAGAVTNGDTTPPSVPQDLHSAPAFAGDSTVRWDASTDNSGAVYHYWVLVDGQQRARPAGTSYTLGTLVDLCRIQPGRHTVTVLAVDRALNRSAQSNAIVMDIR
jgi:hypothetical protein